MNDRPKIDPPDSTAARQGERVLLDPRRPRLLDDRDNVLEVKAGHADIFVIDALNPDDAHRRHLFRIETGEIVLDLQTACGGGRLQIVAVGGPGAEVISLPRTSLSSIRPLARWIARLAQLVTSPAPSGITSETPIGEATDMQAGERRRGPMRNVAWARIVAGTGNLLGFDPRLVQAMGRYRCSPDLDRSREVRVQGARRNRPAGCVSAVAHCRPIASCDHLKP